MEQVACAPRVARERAGALRNGGGAEWQRASEASEWSEGHRRESEGASEGIGWGIGGTRGHPSERSERGVASLRTRMRARVPRTRVR